MEFRVLGPVEVIHEGTSLPLGGSRERAVLALLLLSANRVVSAHRLIEDLWGDTPPEGALQSLRVFVSRLRKALRPAGSEGILLTKSPGYMAQVEPTALDVACFESLLAEGRKRASRGDHDGAAQALGTALGLWRGPALADVSDAPLARAEAARLEEARLAALEERVEADLALGRHGELVAELEALTRAHPLRERLWGHRMVALYRCGRQADALRAFRELSTILGEELGIEPSVPLAHLEVAVLRHLPELQWPPVETASVTRPPATHPDNLPVMPSGFIGRRRELDEIARLLRVARLVTLWGPGGVGKTRLALQAATEALDRFPDGVFFVDLAPLTDAAQVTSRVVASLGLVVDGIEGDTSEWGRRRLTEYLQERHALVVLDNCEHLLDESAHLVDELLRTCPRIVLLATSREALRVPGEFAWPVPPLSLSSPEEDESGDTAASDAVALFCERAAAADPGFRAGPDNFPVVSLICHLLDGIPLALELAAARVRVLSAHEIAQRLDDRLRLLTGGARTAAPRQQTLRATLDWGWELLTDAERTLLRRLAAFRGSFELEAAEAVGADGETIAPLDVLDLIGRLVDKSWIAVERDRISGYRCSETIRQYADEHLEASGEGDACRRRHRDFYLGVVTDKRAPLVYSGEWVARLRAADDNLRAALEWSFTMGDHVAALRLGSGLANYWYMSGQVVEGVARLERALAVSESLRRPARVGAINGLAYLRRQLGDRDGAVRLHHEARSLATEIGDVLGEAVSAAMLAQLALERGELARARVLLERARSSMERQGLPWLAAWADSDLGWVELAQGCVESADRLFHAALDEGGDRTGHMAAAAQSALALTAALRGDAAGCTAMADRAVESAQDMKLPEVLVMALTRTAESAIVLGEPERAQGLLAEALRILLRTGGRSWVASSLEMAAVVGSDSAKSLVPRARLLGAAEAIRNLTGESFRWPHLQTQVVHCVDQLTARLGPAAFTAERAHGRQLRAGAAITLALAELEAPG